MSEETGEVRIIGADPERVVPVTMKCGPTPTTGRCAMTTDDERREVAARLRSAAKTESGSPEYLWNRLEISVNGWRFGDVIDDSYVFYNDVLARLADLIDPRERTCHFVFRDESYSTPDGYEQDGTYYCSACGCDLPDWMQEHVDDIQAGNIDNDIDRCPICGARVVGE